MSAVGPGPGSERDSWDEDALREEDVTALDRLDDRVQEGDGLPDGPHDSEHDE